MRVVGLWRYPVKSMQGEVLELAHVDGHGIAGDRRFAVIDRQTGFTLTARRQPELLQASATLEGDRPRITVAGSVLRDDSDLSDWLGHPVALEQASETRRGRYETPVDAEHEERAWVAWQGPAGCFHDSARTQVSIVSLGSLGSWDVRRFRPNIVIDGGEEDDLVGSVVAIGSARFDVVKKIDRCVVVARPQPGLDADLGILRMINRERATFLGVGAMVAIPGSVAVGDDVISRALVSRADRRT